MSLENELSGVTPIAGDSPIAGTQDAVLESVDGGSDEPILAGDDLGAEGTGEKPGRTIENVYRELLRKQEELDRKNEARFGQVLDLVKSTIAGTTQGGKKPAQTLDDLSLEELRAMRGAVPDEKKPEFDAYFEDRRISEAVNKQVTQQTEAERYSNERRGANQMAVDRYPALKDRNSDLHREVNQRMAQLDPKRIEYNPRIILNLADEVAAEMGIAPRQSTRARSINQPASVGGKKPAKTVQEMTGVIATDEEYERLAARYKHAMPKNRPLNKERIKARSQEWAKHLNGEKE